MAVGILVGEGELTTFTQSFPADAKAVAAKLDQTGWACFENVISPHWIKRAQAHVRALLKEHGEKFFTIVGPADEEGSLASELAHHPLMQTLLRQVTQAGCPQGVVEWEGVYNVLRVVAGPDGHKGSREFHYDASVVTALVPIFIPDDSEGQSGELITLPNRRGYRSLVVNLLEKGIVQSRLYRWMMVSRMERDPGANRRLLKPGNLYLFWGYRTYHGSMPCRSNALRATMLLHYGNPHGQNAVLRGVRNIRKLVERRRLAVGPSAGALATQFHAGGGYFWWPRSRPAPGA